MKIAYCSDLHLEFGPLEFENPGADVLVLSGDILVEHELMHWSEANADFGAIPERALRYHAFMQMCSKKFTHVIYIMGNHEHYHGDFATTITSLREKFAYLENVHILDKETFELGDVLFVGGTLWTDMNREDPLTHDHVGSSMNDFIIVENSKNTVHYKKRVPLVKPVGVTDDEWLKLPYDKVTALVDATRPAKLTTHDAVADHEAMLDVIMETYKTMAPWQSMVVVGHHAPSKLSTHPRYAREKLMNGGYSSDLSEFMLDRPAIKLWIHGHTHESFDYMIGTCRIVCNPRGYVGYESRAQHFTLKEVEV